MTLFRKKEFFRQIAAESGYSGKKAERVFDMLEAEARSATARGELLEDVEFIYACLAMMGGGISMPGPDVDSGSGRG